MPERSRLTPLGTGSDTPLGIFGGTFDPVHYGHLRLAEEALEALNLGDVRWIPAGQPARRTSPRVGAADRLSMVRLAIAGHQGFELDGAEVEAAQPSYTVPTLERLRRPEHIGEQRPLVLLLGADAFAGLGDWHRWASLFDLAHIGVAHRPGFPIDADRLPPALADIFRARFCADPAVLSQTPAGHIVSFAMTQLDISATKIRTLLSKGQSVRFLMPDALIDFIQQHHFYSEN
jgi:nicotinate-nucleotide adenylyltransferase